MSPVGLKQEEFKRLENFIDKSDWQRGPWDSEPDKAEWVDKKTGLPCLIVRVETTGSLCGYVGVSKAHPYFELHYDSFEVEVHGGLTYSDHCGGRVCHEGEEDVWWLGFDTAHYQDLTPGLESRVKSISGLLTNLTERTDPLLRSRGSYKTFDYVKDEVEKLASQLIERKAA